MATAADGTNEISRSLGRNHPMRGEFDLTQGHGHVTCLLAPRIQSE